ncbi:hypothetical protein ACFOWM_00640 [Ferruginibacter yonginensis]|uniref:Uncharacterized protein n=1 Tax=Ferruginibacter yonginensis TaxID=1310416 RepID=A0ABV8QML4_9BACT
MKNLTLLVAALCISIISFAQVKADYSNAFEYNPAVENDAKLVLVDSYNSYLLSYINIDGQLSNHKIILRKFDQKNQLIETFKLDFPKIDASTLYNYVGAIEQPGGKKLIVFTESYSGKSDKQELYMHVFDKEKAAFTTTMIRSFVMESINKKGVFDFKAAENKRFAAMVNVKNSTKKEAVDNTVLMFDATTLSLAWSKDVTLDSKNYEKALAVTNSGKAILIRDSKGGGSGNFLNVVTSSNVDEKQLGEALQLQNPTAVTIGNEEYIVAINYEAKGFRRGDFGKLMLYDINNGKILTNNNIDIFNTIKDISQVQFRGIYIQNNEIQIFAEAKYKAGTRPVKTNAFSTMTFDEPFYKYGPGYLLTMDFEGKLKSTIKLRTDYDALAELYQSFGVTNVRGDYYLIGGGSSIYKLTSDDNYKLKDAVKDITVQIYDPTIDSKDWGSWRAVSQLFTYLPDSKKFIFGRFYNNQLSFITVSNF